MQRPNIVLDTNCLLMSIPSKSKYHKVLTSFLTGAYSLCVTNEIVLEYEEILTLKLGKTIAENLVDAILASSYTKIFDQHYRFGLIQSDYDDNKFADCAIQANAKYIVTQDRHYDILKRIPFPKVEVTDIDNFLEYLSGM